MASKNPTAQQPPSKPPLTSTWPQVGKPWVRRFPTPRIEDYIVSIREDTRTSEFVMPKKGDIFKGVDQQKRLSSVYKFATAVPVEQLPGFVDLYYVAPFKCQEEYNFVVTYPYTDKNYPQFTRTYIVPRTADVATQEPQADTYDPGFGKPFQLTDHKIERLEQDPILDAIFVKVSRVFERLPGPVIVSFESNQAQQVVTVATQEVVKSVPPAQSALTEVSKQERTGTAKAKNTLGTVPRVFPATGLTTEIPSMTRELWLGGFIEYQVQQQLAGQAQQQPLTPGIYSNVEKQMTEFKKESTIRSLPLPQTRAHKEVTSAFGGGALVETLKIDSPTSNLDIEPGYLVTETKLRNLAGFGKVQLTKKLYSPITGAWPKMYGLKTLDEGIYAGIKIDFTKQYVDAKPGASPPGAPDPGGFSDLTPEDTWRTIQIVNKLNLHSLPAPIVYMTWHHVDLPHTLMDVRGVYGGFGRNDSKSEPTSALATASGTALGAIAILMQEGYKGLAEARVTYTFFPTAPQSLPMNILNIQMGTGTAVMRSFSETITDEEGDTVSAFSDSGEQRIHVADIQGCLNGAFAAAYGSGQQRDSYSIPGQTADAKSIDGNFEAKAFFPGASAFLVVNMTRSIPDSLPSGTTYLYDGEVTPWRFGVYVMRTVEITVP
jgi:hypothetical protein